MGKYGYRWLCFRSTFCYVSILKCCLRKIHQPDKMHHNMTKKQSKPSGPKKGCFWVPMYGIWFYSKLEFVYFVLFFYFDIFWLIWLRFITVYPYLSVHPTWSWQEESLMDFLHRAPDPPEDRSVRPQKRRKRRCCEDSALRQKAKLCGLMGQQVVRQCLSQWWQILTPGFKQGRWQRCQVLLKFLSLWPCV